MKIANRLKKSFLPTAGALLLFASTVAFGQDIGLSEEVPELQELQQLAVEMEQAILISSEDEREAVFEQAQHVLARFDRRIAALDVALEQRQDDMRSAASRYASELMVALKEQRQDVSRWLDQIRTNETDSWDNIVFGFNRAYESFYEVWEDLEADFELIE